MYEVLKTFRISHNLLCCTHWPRSSQKSNLGFDSIFRRTSSHVRRIDDLWSGGNDMERTGRVHIGTDKESQCRRDYCALFIMVWYFVCSIITISTYLTQNMVLHFFALAFTSAMCSRIAYHEVFFKGFVIKLLNISKWPRLANHYTFYLGDNPFTTSACTVCCHWNVGAHSRSSCW